MYTYIYVYMYVYIYIYVYAFIIIRLATGHWKPSSGGLLSPLMPSLYIYSLLYIYIYICIYTYQYTYVTMTIITINIMIITIMIVIIVLLYYAVLEAARVELPPRKGGDGGVHAVLRLEHVAPHLSRLLSVVLL